MCRQLHRVPAGAARSETLCPWGSCRWRPCWRPALTARCWARACVRRRSRPSAMLRRCACVKTGIRGMQPCQHDTAPRACGGLCLCAALSRAAPQWELPLSRATVSARHGIFILVDAEPMLSVRCGHPQPGTTAGAVRGRLRRARGRRHREDAHLRRPGRCALAGVRRRPRAQEPLCRAARPRRA